MRRDTLILCLGAVIVALIGVILYMHYRPKENMGPVAPVADHREQPREAPRASAGPVAPVGSSEGDKPALVLFHASWCPHCKDVLPLWPQLKSMVNGQLDVIDIESKDPRMAAHSIRGFPTIRLYPKGLSNPTMFIEHVGPRTIEGITQFLSNPNAGGQ